MRGQEKIIDLRLSGVTPESLWLNDFPCTLDPECIEEIDVSKDDPSLADLRFLVGLTVHIASESSERARAFCEAVKRAGAQFVVTCYSPSEKWYQNGWVEFWTRTDDGWKVILPWPK